MFGSGDWGSEPSAGAPGHGGFWGVFRIVIQLRKPSSFQLQLFYSWCCVCFLNLLEFHWSTLPSACEMAHRCFHIQHKTLMKTKKAATHEAGYTHTRQTGGQKMKTMCTESIHTDWFRQTFLSSPDSESNSVLVEEEEEEEEREEGGLCRGDISTVSTSISWCQDPITEALVGGM